MASPLRLNTIRNEEQFYHPPLPAAQPQMVSMPQGGGSAMNTGVQYPDGSPPDTSNVPPAYLPGDQELMSLIDRNLAQPDVSSQPPSSGLQLASNIGSGRESSDWNWITALGAGLQSAGAAHFGNYNVPQQYLQLKQQADQRKQEFAKQQAALEEQKKQHAFQQVTTVLANKDMSETQKASLLDGFAKGENPQIAQFARTAIDGIGKKRMSRIGLYMDRYPTQMQKLADGMMKGDITADDIDARLGLIDEIEKHNAKLTGEMELESEIKANPNAPPGAKAWLQEREDKRKKEAAEAQIKAQSVPYEEQAAALKPVEMAAKINHLSQESQDKSTLGREAEGLMAKPWNQLTADEKKKVLDFHQQRLVEQQEAGARAREQVKVEGSLAPGVMIHKTMTDMVKGVKDLFLDEGSGTMARIGKMATTRAAFFAGDENMRKWSQMEDGMRATLARMAMEVGNLAATEQDRAKQLVPDLYGSLYGVPDSKQVAEKKLQLLGEFLQAGLEGPQGPDAQSRVQNKLRETLAKLDDVAPLPKVGNVSPDEEQLIKSMQAEGKDKRSIQAEILKRRGQQ